MLHWRGRTMKTAMMHPHLEPRNYKQTKRFGEQYDERWVMRAVFGLIFGWTSWSRSSGVGDWCVEGGVVDFWWRFRKRLVLSEVSYWTDAYSKCWKLKNFDKYLDLEAIFKKTQEFQNGGKSRPSDLSLEPRHKCRWPRISPARPIKRSWSDPHSHNSPVTCCIDA